MILGAFLTFNGKIYESVFAYLFADFIWILLSLKVGDIFGVITISIGVILGLGAFYKMHIGKFKRSIRNG